MDRRAVAIGALLLVIASSMIIYERPVTPPIAGRASSATYDLLKGVNASLTLKWPEGPLRGFLSDELIADLNLWNVKGGAGYACMKPVNGGVEFIVNLSNVTLRRSKGRVIGYPEIYYGCKPWSGLRTASIEGLNLPLQVRELPDVTVTVNYELILSSNSGVDAAFDLWLTKHPCCRVSNDSVEVMIWLYRHNARPAGERVGTALIGNSLWGVWVRPSSSGRWALVTFVRIPNAVNGTVKVPLTYLVVKALSYLNNPAQKSRGLTCKTYLNDIEFGLEFRRAYLGGASFKFIINSFKITVSPTSPAH